MRPPEATAETFQEKVCRHFGVPASRYDETVLRLTLYPHAQWLRLFGSSQLLTADRRFIIGVGRLTRWRGFAAEVRAFQGDPQNALFWRRSLRLRVSVMRMRALFSEVWEETVPDADHERADGGLTGDPSLPLAD
jgi:hypothetical protein